MLNISWELSWVLYNIGAQRNSQLLKGTGNCVKEKIKPFPFKVVDETARTESLDQQNKA